MDLSLTPQQLALQERARDFAAQEVAPGAADRDRTGRPDPALFAKLAAQGWLGLLWPPEHGGAGLGLLELALIVEPIAGACLSTAISIAIHTCLAAGSITLAGSETQRRHWLPQLAAGGLGAFALTEPEAGSDPGSLTATLTRTPRGLVLNGLKTWVSNAGLAKAFVVFASEDLARRHQAITALVVPAGADGVVIEPAEPTLGLRAVDIRTVRFEGVHIDEDALLGPPGRGWPTILMAFDRVRLALAAAALGAAGAALMAGADYAVTRRQFGVAIGTKQAVQTLLAESQVELEALRGLVTRAAWLADRGEPFGLASAQAKVFGARVANAVADRVVQIFGGAGYAETNPAARFFRDARAFRLLGGSDEIQRYVIARGLLEPRGLHIQP